MLVTVDDRFRMLMTDSLNRYEWLFVSKSQQADKKMPRQDKARNEQHTMKGKNFTQINFNIFSDCSKSKFISSSFEFTIVQSPKLFLTSAECQGYLLAFIWISKIVGALTDAGDTDASHCLKNENWWSIACFSGFSSVISTSWRFCQS